MGQILGWMGGAAVVTFGLFILRVVYQGGHHSARLEALEKWRDGTRVDVTTRVEALEKWRDNVRRDMHEISDKFEVILTEVKALRVLIDERTDRRSSPRSSLFECPIPPRREEEDEGKG